MIIISLNNLGPFVLDGIPEYVEIETSIPASVFYTLDGTLPTPFSSQYADPIRMPTDSGRVALSVVAYFLDGYGDLVPSSVVTEIYEKTPITSVSKARRLSYQGIVYIYPGGLDIPFWYDHTGAASVFVDIEPEALLRLMTPSERNEDGTYREDVGGGTQQTSITQIYNRKQTDSPSNLGLFDPNAPSIVIDGRNDRDLNTILLSNGPYMSLRDSERQFGGRDLVATGINSANYISGQMVKPHYNREKNIIVFYYFDSNASRWIKSIQHLPDPMPSGNISPISNPFVSEWMPYGVNQNV